MKPSLDSEILRRLRGGEGFTPGEELGEPPVVALRMAGLREAGYQIEHHPHFGYRLVSGPDRLIADDILSRMPGTGWIREVLVFQKIGSTNDLITGLARDGAAAGVVAFAEEQTAGRGRLGRRWQSDTGCGLWFSMLLRPDWMPPAHWPRLTLWLAYALAQAILRFCELRVTLKWPNDLHVSGRKLAGILVETSLGENAFATAGIGLNVNQLGFPGQLEETATSLRMEREGPVDRNGLAGTILTTLDETLPLVETGFEKIIAWAAEADCLKGRWVSATAGSVVLEGIAEGIDGEGALLIRPEAGEVTRIRSGEVTRFSAAAG